MEPRPRNKDLKIPNIASTGKHGTQQMVVAEHSKLHQTM
jgi:hypothetical protein